MKENKRIEKNQDLKELKGLLKSSFILRAFAKLEVYNTRKTHDTDTDGKKMRCFPLPRQMQYSYINTRRIVIFSKNFTTYKF